MPETLITTTNIVVPADGSPAAEAAAWYAGAVAEVEAAGIPCRAVPLWMTDVDASAAMAQEALAFAEAVRGA